MSEESEFRQRIAAHEARFLRPHRLSFESVASLLGYRGESTGPQLWQRAAERLLPAEFVGDTRRQFRVSAKQLRALGHGNSDGPGTWPVPLSAHAALLFASDPEGMCEAETHARELLELLRPWGGPAAERVVWRLNGHPIDRPRAGQASLGLLRPVLALIRAVLGGPRRVGEPRHAHPRFQPVVDRLSGSRRRRHLADYELPAWVDSPIGRLAVPAALVGRALGELPDPFDPWLALTLTGYQLWAVQSDPHGARIELAAPFGPRRDHHPRPDPTRVREAERRRRVSLGPKPSESSIPRAVWSGRTSRVRLAAARGDLGMLRELLPGLPRVLEPGQPPLTSYAAYGGPEALAMLAEFDWLELDARDHTGATPLMYAAGLPSQGPRDGSIDSLSLPISALVGAKACRWLIAAGAELEALDHRGRTALHWAIEAGNEACVTALLEGGANIEARDPLGRTALLLALSKLSATPKPSMLFELMTHRETPAPPVVEQLMQAKPDADVRDHQGWGALHYLAVSSAGVGQRSLSKRLLERGAQPSRDRSGLTPAGICQLRNTDHHDRGAFDPETSVAAGPGPWPPFEPPPRLVSRLIESLCPPPEGPPTRRRLRGPRARRVELGDWMVWADWLQNHGDARGELVAASLACAGMGGRKRKDRLAARERIEHKSAAWIERSIHRVAHGPMQRGELCFGRTHGFVTRANLCGGTGLSVEESLESARLLLLHEPLLFDLRFGAPAVFFDTHDPFDWPSLFAGLSELGPHHGVRRLVLTGLPARLPELSSLVPIFPNLHSLVLHCGPRLEAGELRWPGLRSLWIQDLSHRAQEAVRLDLHLDLPALTHLDLRLTGLGSERELRALGFAKLLERLPALEFVTMKPLWPELADRRGGGARKLWIGLGP